jgi:hypothetical protein
MPRVAPTLVIDSLLRTGPESAAHIRSQRYCFGAESAAGERSRVISTGWRTAGTPPPTVSATLAARAYATTGSSRPCFDGRS